MAMNFLYNAFVAPDPREEMEKEGLNKAIEINQTLSTTNLPVELNITILKLLDLVQEQRKVVGDNCLAQLGSILNHANKDSPMVRNTLNIISHLLIPFNAETSDEYGRRIAFKLSDNTEILNGIFNCLEDKEFYIRYEGLITLQKIHEAAPNQVQAGLLASPLAIGRIIDILDEPREVIRNECLLFLIAITGSNADIQQILAFQGVFEKLLDTSLNEEGLDGGIVVQDCLSLILNLLRTNSSNQVYFRESNCFKRLLQFLDGVVDQVDPVDWTNPQKHANLNYLLSILRHLSKPRSTHTLANLDVLGSCGMLSRLIKLVALPPLPNNLQAHILFIIGNCIANHPRNQDIFSAATVDIYSGYNQYTNPFILHVISLAVGRTHAKPHDADIVRLGATYVAQSYLQSNTDAQLALTSTLRPPPGHFEDNDDDDTDQASPTSPGSMIITALFEEDVDGSEDLHAFFASVLLTHLLYSNEQCKSIAQGILLRLTNFDNPIGLLTCVAQRFLSAESNSDNSPHAIRTSIAFISLLAVWLYGNPIATSEFLSEGAHLQFLIELMNPTTEAVSHPILSGVAAFILNTLLKFNDDATSSFKTSTLRALIYKRVGGADALNHAILALSDLPQWRDSKPWYQLANYFPDGLDQLSIEVPYTDHLFVTFFKSHSDFNAPPINLDFRTVQSPDQVLRADVQTKPTESPAVNLDNVAKDKRVLELEAEVAEFKKKELLYQEEIRKLKIAFEKAEAYIQFLQIQQNLPSPSAVETDSNLSVPQTLEVDMNLDAHIAAEPIHSVADIVSQSSPILNSNSEPTAPTFEAQPVPVTNDTVSNLATATVGKPLPTPPLHPATPATHHVSPRPSNKGRVLHPAFSSISNPSALPMETVKPIGDENYTENPTSPNNTSLPPTSNFVSPPREDPDLVPSSYNISHDSRASNSNYMNI